jgi:hypothetical protein
MWCTDYPHSKVKLYICMNIHLPIYIHILLYACRSIHICIWVYGYWYIYPVVSILYIDMCIYVSIHMTLMAMIQPDWYVYIHVNLGVFIYTYVCMYIYISMYMTLMLTTPSGKHSIHKYLCIGMYIYISLFYFVLFLVTSYLYVNSLTYAFGWSAFFCRSRFHDTLVVIFFK